MQRIARSTERLAADEQWRALMKHAYVSQGPTLEEVLEKAAAASAPQQPGQQGEDRGAGEASLATRLEPQGPAQSERRKPISIQRCSFRGRRGPGSRRPLPSDWLGTQEERP